MSTERNPNQSPLGVDSVAPENDVAENTAQSAPAAPSPPALRHTNGRFVKGHTGNAKGRPKKRLLAWSQRQKDLAVLREAYRMVPVKVDGKTELITMREATIRGMMMKAAKGDEKAFKAIEKAIAEAQRDHERRNPGTFHWLEQCELEAEHPRLGTVEEFQDVLDSWAKSTRR